MKKTQKNLKSDFKIVLGILLAALVIYIITNPGAAKFPSFKPSTQTINQQFNQSNMTINQTISPTMQTNPYYKSGGGY